MGDIPELDRLKSNIDEIVTETETQKGEVGSGAITEGKETDAEESNWQEVGWFVCTQKKRYYY